MVEQGQDKPFLSMTTIRSPPPAGAKRSLIRMAHLAIIIMLEMKPYMASTISFVAVIGQRQAFHGSLRCPWPLPYGTIVRGLSLIPCSRRSVLSAGFDLQPTCLALDHPARSLTI
jgi:hypothetical protein